MARAARKPTSESVGTNASLATKPKRTSRKKKQEVLVLDDSVRIEEPDRWDHLSAVEADRVEQIAAAFALNKISGGSLQERIKGLASDLASGEGDYAETAPPSEDPEQIEAARQRMRELLGETAPSERLSRASLIAPRQEFDTELEARLREIVRATVQEMLGGETGQKLSAGIRRMVRREVEAQIALERAS